MGVPPALRDYTLQVYDSKDNILLERRSGSSQELKEIFYKYQSRGKWGWLQSLAMPLDQSCYSFFPTFSRVNIGIMALQILVSLGALFLDLLTLPLRVLATACKKEEPSHPILKLLQSHLLKSQAVKDNVLYLVYEKRVVQAISGGFTVTTVSDAKEIFLKKSYGTEKENPQRIWYAGSSTTEYTIDSREEWQEFLADLSLTQEERIHLTALYLQDALSDRSLRFVDLADPPEEGDNNQYRQAIQAIVHKIQNTEEGHERAYYIRLLSEAGCAPREQVVANVLALQQRLQG